MGEGGIKNGQKNFDVFYGRPHSTCYYEWLEFHHNLVVYICSVNPTVAQHKKQLQTHMFAVVGKVFNFFEYLFYC